MVLVVTITAVKFIAGPLTLEQAWTLRNKEYIGWLKSHGRVLRIMWRQHIRWSAYKQEKEAVKGDRLVE